MNPFDYPFAAANDETILAYAGKSNMIVEYDSCVEKRKDRIFRVTKDDIKKIRTEFLPILHNRYGLATAVDSILGESAFIGLCDLLNWPEKHRIRVDTTALLIDKAGTKKKENKGHGERDGESIY